MAKPPDDRFVVTATERITRVVMTLGDVEVAVRMPSAPSLMELGAEQIRQAALRQVRQVLEVACEELG